MRYKWLAHHLVRRRFPDLDKQTHDEIISEAICRAWCTFLAPNYRLMQACISAAARRKGLLPPTGSQPTWSHPQDKIPSGTRLPQRTIVQMSDYR